jgi:hypothetical protein
MHFDMGCHDGACAVVLLHMCYASYCTRPVLQVLMRNLALEDTALKPHVCTMLMVG